jgi:hypothetical protein
MHQDKLTHFEIEDEDGHMEVGMMFCAKKFLCGKLQ